MEKKAILFIDVDDNHTPSYNYRNPHFQAAKENGLSCLIATNNQKNISVLTQNCDELVLIKNVSVNDILELVGNLSSKYHIKAIFCHAGHTSKAAEVGAIVAETCEILGFNYSPVDAIKACNNKFLMRVRLREFGVKSVEFALCHNAEQLINKANEIGYPLIFKPPYGAGSSYIKKCDNEEELLKHYYLFTSTYQDSSKSTFYPAEHDIVINGKIIDYYNPNITILLEQYITGSEGTVECIVTDGEVYPLIINEKLVLTEKSGTILENLLICPAFSYTEEDKRQIKNYATSCLKALGLRNDIVHLEFRLTNEGPVIIEVNPRLGGLYVDEAFKDIAGIDPYALYIDMLLNNTVDINQALSQAKVTIANCSDYYSMMVIYPEYSGYFKGFSQLNYLDNQENIIKYECYPSYSMVNAEVEENYLLKCWVRVNDACQALLSYKRLLDNVIPTILPTALKNKKETINKDIDTMQSFFAQNYYTHIKNYKDFISCDDDNVRSFKVHWSRLVDDDNFKDYTHRKRRILRYTYDVISNTLNINRDSEYKSSVKYDIPYQQGVNKLTYVEENFIHHPITQQLIAMDIDFFKPHLDIQGCYEVNVHLFRVQTDGERTSPTTSGIHQDGMDFIAMHFVDAHNTVDVVSKVYASNQPEREVFSKPMRVFLETLLVNDQKLYHSASEVRQNKDTDHIAYRDLLLVTLHKMKEI
ncbi:2OG-Fe dioxygenase family protein [Francisella sp. 19X1-34]|uniref:2OG-Fe dioxygenase family protein n=1 Tax=Francisella sp. 19X1-34 TaxID=3087177 RepID=UPI002E2FEDED|nr:2OG-Fe dioxygenase family protein [Francisella sp. 19X1-34]MED7788168.1 2OG-Fe dioxygenase family protein [Francisella sp. 19X1-34]